MQIKKNKDYTLKKLDEFAEEENYEVNELGNGTIGENFLVLKHSEKDITISFVMTGYSDTQGAVYTCVYSDLKET